MKILLVIEGTYPWYRGGVSEWIYQYLKACSKFEFSILQIATDTYQQLDPKKALYPLTDNVVNFTRILPPEIGENWDSSMEDWFKENQSVFHTSSSDVDLIHVTNTGFAGWLGSRLKEYSFKPLILTEHAIYWLEILKGAVALECGYKIPDENSGKEVFAVAFKSIAKIVYKAADKVITVSECNISYQHENGAQDVEYIPNGIPKSWIINSENKNDMLTIGWVGRCAEMKNPLQFFDFIDSFRTEKIEINFLMLLSDANEHNLEVKVRERAKKYTGFNFVWNQPSKEYYQKMDMLLITSHNESQPLVLFEALANQVLPIGREVGDFNLEYGLSFPRSTSTKNIAQSVLLFWKDTVERNSYIKKRVERVKNYHTWEKIFTKYESSITSLVNNKEYSI